METGIESGCLACRYIFINERKEKEKTLAYYYIIYGWTKY
jgi:hypothetical protein